MTTAPAIIDGESILAAISRDLQKGSTSLPMLPRAAGEALELARSTSFDVARLSQVISSEPALAARLLSVANSALYARGQQLASVRHAIVRLGPQATRDVLYQSVYATVVFDAPGFRDLVDASFHRGVVGAKLARELSRRFAVDADVAYLCALLRDIGEARCWRLVAKRRPRGFEQADALAAVAMLHGQAGAELAMAWRLPAETQEACTGHHAEGGTAVVRLTRFVDLLVDTAVGRVDPQVLEELAAASGLSGELPSLLVAAKEADVASAA